MVRYIHGLIHRRDTSGIRQVGTAKDVCTELTKNLKNHFYTSYELTLKFFNVKTHVVGTVRHNKRFMPKYVVLPIEKK